jgi:hypothetical protein
MNPRFVIQMATYERERRFRVNKEAPGFRPGPYKRETLPRV